MCIKRIKANIALRKEYKLTFCPFFDAWVKEKRSIKHIELYSIPANLKSIYEVIKEKNKKKFAKYIELYESYEKETILHNEEIEEINCAVNNFKANEVYDNVLTYDYMQLKSYYDIALKLSKYDVIEGKYSSFKNDVSFLYYHFDEIKEQCNLYNRQKAIFDKIDAYGDYIDFRIAEPLINESRDINSAINDRINYYNFEKYKNIEDYIKKYNAYYIRINMHHPLLSNINGKSLDEEQREAVLTDEINNLIVAGAGSGKTLTICGKVEFLIKEKGVKPEDILLLSYSKKSAEDLMYKVENIDDRLTVGTFHKLGLDILKYTQNRTFVVEEQFAAIIEKYFREELKENIKALRNILNYYGLFLSNNEIDKKYKNDGELFADLKKQDFSTLKDQLAELSDDIYKRKTLKKELVKSYQELVIANWYFINGIDYEYEKPYSVDLSNTEKRQYLPDFYLPKYCIYHEHYGVNKDGKALQFESTKAQEYVDTMNWKRGIHSMYQTTCLETYSYEFDDGTIFQKLEKDLKKQGVEFKPLSSKEVYNAFESIYQGKSFKSFINLIKSFLSLYKTRYKDETHFSELKKHDFNNKYSNLRASLFLDIAKDIYLYYINSLRISDKIDFDDMILKSIEALDTCNQFKYRYIIVDEFQDISYSRMLFLKKLLDHGNAKLFAVGDDWQAIYRFSGCDLGIFLNFQEYFGRSEIKKITTTHRNSQELQDIAGPFIKKNPEQFDKKIKSVKHLTYPIQIMFCADKKYYAFMDILNSISKLDASASILILGRNNKDFESIALDKRIYIDYKESNDTKTVVKVKDYPNMNFTYSTVHGSKGLEEDYVILINADDAKLGFPNKMEDDILLEMVLSSKSNYEFAEERRLWYVALTRTKNYTYIIANDKYPSSFIDEIISQCCVMNPDIIKKYEREFLCPKCQSGRLILRKNEKDDSEFFGCSNYPYCKYTNGDIYSVNRNKRCVRCGDFMVVRDSKHGLFYGCHSYPNCTYKEPYSRNY